MKQIFSTDFRKIRKCKISWTSVQLELSCPSQIERGTDKYDKADVPSRNFAKTSKNSHYVHFLGSSIFRKISLCRTKFKEMNLAWSTQKYQKCTLKFPFVIHLRVVFIYADVNRMLADVLKSIGCTINRVVNSVVSSSSVTLLSYMHNTGFGDITFLTYGIFVIF